MGDMMKVFVDREIEGQIREKYPHMRNPSGVCAKIVQAETNRQPPGTYQYVVRILDQDLNTDDQYPEIPGVISSLKLDKGDIVVALFLYGGTDVYIVGRRYA